MINHMQHPDLLEDFVKLQELFLSDVLFEYTQSEIIDWLSNLTAEDIKSILNRHKELQDNGCVVPFTYIKYKAIPRRDVIDYLRHLIDQHALIPEDNPVLKKTKKNFDVIFSERVDFKYY
jgi:hypothetical protein